MTDSLTTKTCKTCLGTRRVLHMWDRPGGSPGNGWGPCFDCAKTHPEIPGFVPVSIDPCLAKREQITEGRLSTIGALRYIIAAYILMLAGIIAPQELGFLESLAAAARYASNRVKEGRHV